MAESPKNPTSTPDTNPHEVVARSVGGAAATSLAALASRGAGFLTTVVVTYFVSRAEYGNANLAMIIAAVLNTATLLSPQQALLTRHDRFDEAAALCRFYAAWSGLFFAIVLALVGGSLLSLLKQPEATPILWVFCIALFLERVVVIPALHLNYRLRFSELARMDLSANVVYLGVTITSAMAGQGGFSLAYGLCARHLTRLWMLATVLGPRAVVPSLPGWGERERHLAREILHYSIPVHLGSLGEFLTLYLDNVLVGRLYGASAQGLYVVAYTLAMTPCDTIAQQGAIALTRALGLKDVETRRRTYLKGLRYMSTVLFPMAAITAVTAGTLQEALLPPKWRDIAPVTAALCVGALSMGVVRLAFAQLSALHRPRLAATSEILRLVFFVISLAAVTVLDRDRSHLPWIGAGVSVAFALSAMVGFVLSLRADGLLLRQGLSALVPPALGTAITVLCLQALRVALTRIGMPLSFLRFVLELALGISIFVLYVRVVHKAMFQEMRTFIRGQILGRMKTG